ncbi:MAG: T9SS type A sorting domain-containing protein, partial [bacterium]
DADGIAGYFDNIEIKPLPITIFTEDFETGTVSADWGVYRFGEENVEAISMSTAPAPLANGGDYVGYVHDADASYNGAAIVLAGETSLQNYSIEGDVYCYVNHAGGSAYTGLAVYADSTVGTYIKLVADFDVDQRLRLYNNHLDMQTLKYTFDHTFSAVDVPGGIPSEDGWHHMKVEVKTVDDTTTAFWCYFDGELLVGCPVYDTSRHQMDSGQFGLYAFQMDADGIAGYFDNIIIQSYEIETSVEEWPRPETATIPNESRLAQNYPNPFNPETHISYRVISTEFVNLTIYDLLGRKIRTLISETRAPGNYIVIWDGRDENGYKMPSGVYMYTLKSDDFIETKKMLMMK